MAGSLLVASSAAHVNGLQAHVEQLNAAGINAEYLTASALLKVEPSLAVDSDGGAAFVPEDSQIDAALAVGLFREVSASSISMTDICVSLKGHSHTTTTWVVGDCSLLSLVIILNDKED